MWVKSFRLNEEVSALDEQSFTEAVNIACELVRDGCDYRRAIRIAIAQAQMHAETRAPR